MIHKQRPGSTLARLLGMAVLATLAGAPALSAQDASTVFQQGMDAWRSGDLETARSRFREVVRMEPERMDALRLLHESQDAILELLYQGEEWETMAREILAAARTGSREHMRDAAAARDAAAGVFSASERERAQAIFRLSYEFGPFAVPPLVEELGSADGDRRLAAVYALSRLGTEAAVPLMAALDAADPQVRLGAVQALGLMDDARATAWFADLAANDDSGPVRALAARLGGGGDAAALHHEQGKAYFLGDVAGGLTPVENQGVLWYASGSGIAWVEVPRPLVPLEMAKIHFLRARELGDETAAVGLALAYAGQISVLEALSARGDDVGEMLASQVGAALTLPAAVLDHALLLAMEFDRPATAAALVRLLDGPGLQPGDGLMAAATAEAPMVRYPAAIALAHAGHGDATVSTLASAVGYEAPRIVVLADDDAARRGALAEGLASQDVTVMASADGAGGLANLVRAIHVDSIVVADGLPDLYARRFVRETRRNPRFADTPIFVLGREDTGDIEGATVVDALAAADVIAAFGPLGAEREANLRLASEAAAALADLARTQPSAVAGVTGALAAVLDHDDAVAVPAMSALAWGGAASALDALGAVVADRSRSTEARVAAADAIAGVLGRNPGAAVDAAALEAAAAEGDADLTRACSRALGMAGGAPAAARLVPSS